MKRYRMGIRLASMLVVWILMCTVFVGLIGFSGPVKADIQGDWVEEIIKDTPTTVSAVAIGDVDADGINEVVIGMYGTVNEVRLYKRENGIWMEHIIADTPVGVKNVAIGDADNDGLFEIVCTLFPTTNDVRMYKYVNDIWIEENITNAPVQVYSMAIGDADNDGWNEVVIGLSSTTFELRAYQKSGLWIEDNITDAPNTINSLAIGDADNDGANEVVIGMGGNKPPPFPVYITNETRAYEWNGSAWIEENITDTGNLDVTSLVIGDPDEDGKNEVCISKFYVFGGGAAVETYEKKGASWVLEYLIPAAPGSASWVGGVDDTDNDGINELLVCEGEFWGIGKTKMVVWENISGIIYGDLIVNDLPNGPRAVIGDVDSDGVNEVIIGLGSTTHEVRLFANDRGNIVFTSHDDGDYISGTEHIEVMVTSNYVNAVRFYLDGVLMFTDTLYPYQFVLDTTSLSEDAVYTLKAQGRRGSNPPIESNINLIVNNALQTGDFLAVSTLRNVYAPDQDVSVLIGIKSPPWFDSLNLMVGYADPNDNNLFTINESLPYSSRYIVGLPLFSDAVLGIYNVTATAYGYVGDTLIWEATNSTNFTVSGESIGGQLDNIMNNLTSFDPSIILSYLQGMNVSLFNEIQTLLLRITENVTMMNASLSDQLTSLLDNMTTGNNSLRTWLEIVLGAVDANLTATKDTLQTQLSDLDTYMTGFNHSLQSDLDGISSDLLLHDQSSGQNHSVIQGILGDISDDVGALDLDELKTMLTDLAQNVSTYNESIAGNIMGVVDDIDDFRTGTDQKLDAISTTSEDLANLNSIITALGELDQDLQTAEDVLQASIDNIPTDKEEEGFGITEGLLMVVLVLLIIVILMILMGRKGKAMGEEAILEDEIEPKSTAAEEGEEWEEPEKVEEEYEEEPVEEYGEEPEKGHEEEPEEEYGEEPEEGNEEEEET